MIKSGQPSNHFRAWLDEEIPPKYTASQVVMFVLFSASPYIFSETSRLVQRIGGRALIGWTPRSVLEALVFSALFLGLPLFWVARVFSRNPEFAKTRRVAIYALIYTISTVIWGIGMSDYSNYDLGIHYYKIED